jgi:DNA-directed RNA polymerase specialized sigma24 family protein
VKRIGCSAMPRGDQAAVRSLVERHRERLRRMVALRLDSRVSARVDASDVVQEALFDATRKLAEYERERPLPIYPWLHRLTARESNKGATTNRPSQSNGQTKRS